VKTPKTDSHSLVSKDEGSGAFSLTERIRLRENSGDLQAFNETYNNLKKSPTKNAAKTILKSKSLNEKREAEFDLEKPKKKKVKGNNSEGDSDFDIESYNFLEKTLHGEEEYSSGLYSRPKRTGTATRKRLIISDDEGDDEMKNLKINIGEDNDEEFML